MARIFRVLFVSAIITGAAAVVLYGLGVRPEPRQPAAIPPPSGPGDEVDRLSDEEQQMLLRELGGQL